MFDIKIYELILIAFGLSTDALAVSISNGLAMPGLSRKKVFLSAFIFGSVQCIMPIIGYKIGTSFSYNAVQYNNVVALVLLCFIGVKMIWNGLVDADVLNKENVKENFKRLNDDNIESFKPFGLNDTASNYKYSVTEIVIQAFATSIDALIMGMGFASMQISNEKLHFAAILIGVITALISYIGIRLGKKVGEVIGTKAQMIGGLILIVIGLKVFFEHI